MKDAFSRPTIYSRHIPYLWLPWQRTFRGGGAVRVQHNNACSLCSLSIQMTHLPHTLHSLSTVLHWTSDRPQTLLFMSLYVDIQCSVITDNSDTYRQIMQVKAPNMGTASRELGLEVNTDRTKHVTRMLTNPSKIWNHSNRSELHAH
jgi:hypothetical protein